MTNIKLPNFVLTELKQDAKQKHKQTTSGKAPPPPHSRETEKQEDGKKTTTDITRTPIKEQRPQQTAHTSPPVYT